jgi:acetyl-CoA acetyltransferase family protein
MDAACRISAGLADCIAVGGAESMSRAPYVMSKAQTPYARNQQMWDTAIGWRFPNPAMEKLFPLFGMGETAEEVRDKYDIKREDQDQFAFDSHQKAIKAQDSGAFDDEIVPVHIKLKKEQFTVSIDEGPRRATSLEKLASLRAAFRKDGTVTAGNSSSINDGAALLLIVSEKFMKENKLTPIARITGGGIAGLDPNVMGLGPIYATQKLCKRYGKKTSDFDLIELNEAFAVQSLACLKELDFDPSKVNRNGGAIALGHPLGCSGARIITTLVHQMKKDKNIKQGLATMCIGVGQGVALSVENCL